MAKFLNKILNFSKNSTISNSIIKRYNINRINPQNEISNSVKNEDLLICYAPFNNILFNSQGQVTACCRSSLIFDSIQEKSIKDIWFGDNFEKLRKPIIHGSLSNACKTCRYPLEKEDFDNVFAKIFDKNNLNKNKYPAVIEFDLSNTCNLECIMCHGNNSSSIRKNREKRAPSNVIYDDNFITQLKEFIPFISEAKFYGGEPFLIDIYYNIFDIITEINPNVEISITTNGTVLNDRIKELLAKNKFNITMSIDSVQKDTYESIRRNAKYEVVFNNMTYFHEYCIQNNTKFCISICPIKQNWHEMHSVVEYFNNINTLIYFNTVYTPHQCSLWSLNKNELQNIINKLSQYSLPEDNEVQISNKIKYDGLINLLISWRDETMENKNKKYSAYI